MLACYFPARPRRRSLPTASLAPATRWSARSLLALAVVSTFIMRSFIVQAKAADNSGRVSIGVAHCSLVSLYRPVVLFFEQMRAASMTISALTLAP